MLPFPAVPGIVHQRKGCAENRGRALSPLGKVCIELQHGPGSSHKDAEFFCGLSAYISFFSPALIHPESTTLCSKSGILIAWSIAS